MIIDVNDKHYTGYELRLDISMLHHVYSGIQIV